MAISSKHLRSEETEVVQRATCYDGSKQKGSNFMTVDLSGYPFGQERGNRVVHFYLKDSAGESILAVVGTERSVRHMCYVVAEEFLEICGKEGSIPTGFKWRSRREVVDWLTSMLSKQHLQGDRSAHEITNGSVNEVTGLSAQIADDKDILKSNSKLSNSEIVWSGVAWTCGKQLKHYPAFCRNGIKIAIRSFVFVMGKGEKHYIAYLEDMYEDRRGQKKVKVRWFHHNQEVKGARNPHPREIFITPYSQVISAECVDGPATVLTREHYEKCMPSFSPTSTDRIHLCFRQFRGNKVKPFDLSKLRGYYAQPVLSCLHLDTIQNTDSKSNSLTGEDEDLNISDDTKLGAKRSRSDKGSPQSQIGRQGVRKLVRSKQMMVYETFQVVNYARPDRRLFSLKQIECQPMYNPTYKVDDKIELLCQDSGIRGCWFRCTVLQVARKQLKVHYDDVQDEDGSGNLEEWIPAFKLAKPDKLGMRHSGRPTIRPAPTYEEQELAIEVGTAVDAWWSDGWWEGVVTRNDNCGDDSVQVYFPGESLLKKVRKKDLRISRDWLGDRWINIKSKPDITSTIFTDNNFNTKLSMSPSKAKDVDSVGFANSCHDVLPCKNSNELDAEEKFVSFDGVAEDGDCVHDNKPPSEKRTSGPDCKAVELMEVDV
ncbi:Bromo adjacent-like proteiny [Sesbania bispinosa]|nr:Bromo adjacent-like proteiny [Sesbania bispinosa]